MSNTTKKETKNGSWNECSENTERAVIIEKNPEALLQRVRLIKNAKKEIILSTFAFQSDESGKLILGALHDAADRGVHVRLLVDGMESWVDMEGNPYFYGLSSISIQRSIPSTNRRICTPLSAASCSAPEINFPRSSD